MFPAWVIWQWSLLIYGFISFLAVLINEFFHRLNFTWSVPIPKPRIGNKAIRIIDEKSNADKKIRHTCSVSKLPTNIWHDRNPCCHCCKNLGFHIVVSFFPNHVLSCSHFVLLKAAFMSNTYNIGNSLWHCLYIQLTQFVWFIVWLIWPKYAKFGPFFWKFIKKILSSSHYWCGLYWVALHFFV